MGLLSIVPWYVRAGVIVALPIAGFAVGWYKSAESANEKADLLAASEHNAALTAQLQGAQRHAQDLQNSKDRVVQLGKDLDAARGITAGMADRVQRLQTQLRASSSTPSCPGNGDFERGSGSAQFIEELSRRSQSVYDAAGRCGAQEQSLMSKPLCECSDLKSH